MKSKGTTGLIILLFLIFALVMGRQLVRGGATRTLQPAQIAVIVYGSANDDRWNALDQGIRQACRELEIETPTISMAAQGDAAAQLALLERELESGARGVLLAVEDSEQMAGALRASPLTVPVVYIHNAPTGEMAVAANGAALAGALAAALAGDVGHVAVAADALQRDSVRARLDAFEEAMRAQGTEVTVLTPGDGRSMRQTIASELTFRKPEIDVLVALDTEMLESVIDAVSSAMTEARIVGIGSSDKVVSALDRGVISDLVYQNEYAIGYLGLMRLAAEMNLIKAPPEGEVQWMAVDRESMFAYEAERLLFPFNP